MPLTEKQILEIRDALDTCKHPLFFFHDDADGLASFLLLYRYKREGQGIPIKATPNINERFINKVKSFGPDKIFVLDVAGIEQDFIDEVKTEIIWIDHHEPQERTGVKYYNPRCADHEDGTPVSELCYQITEKDQWIAAVGTVGDWTYSDMVKEFSEKYPTLLPQNITTPEKALFCSPIGTLVDVFSFILKGKTKDAYVAMKILTRIDKPEEILNQTTSSGSFLFKKYTIVNNDYQRLLRMINENKSEDDKIILFIYGDENISFTKEISNRMLFDHPDKVIIIGRERNGTVKMSLRGAKVNILKILEKSLEGTSGFGGGHEHACGAVVKKEEFDQFIENIRAQL